LRASICPDGQSWLGIIPNTLFIYGDTMENKTNRCIKKSFRFTENEWLLIEKKCDDANITTTQYFQQIAVHGKTAKRDCLKEKKIYMGQIAMIGNNINQIARKLNSDEKVDLWMLQLLLKIEKYLNRELLP
jgi:hypothetical protein